MSMSVLSAIVATVQAGDVPCAELRSWQNGILTQRKSAMAVQIGRGSANIRNSIGNYYECMHPDSSVQDEGLPAFEICVGDLQNPSHEFPIRSHGICLPVTKKVDIMHCILNGNDSEFNDIFGINSSDIYSLQVFRDLSRNSRNTGNGTTTASKSDHFVYHCGDSAQRSFDTGGWVMATLSSVLLLLCVISQIVEYYEASGDGAGTDDRFKPADARDRLINAGPDHRTWPLWRRVGRKLLKAFCPADAVSTLMERTNNRLLSGLDGLRSFSMLWIILAHTTLLVCLLGTDDQDALVENLESLPQQFTLGASLAVDTFFFLSGLLTTFTLLKRMRKSSKTSFPAGKFILLRFLRLTPLYAYILFFYTYLVPYFASGPVWYRMLDDTALCRKHWWTNLLYINEFYPASFHSTCMSWSWYLANDMCFFIIGLAILFIYLRNKYVGIGLSVALTVVGVTSGWWLLVHHRQDVQDDYYDKPYTRITPFTIGILLGILFIDYDFVNIHMSDRKAGVLMAASVVAILAVVYVDYTNFMHPNVGKVLASSDAMTAGDFSNTENAAYQAGGRLIFAVAISVLTLLCVTGNGGIVNSFLSCGFWEPLGKLTYGAYLVHPIVIRAYYYQKVQLFHFDVFEQSMYFLSISVLSYGLAAVLHIMVEIPFANLAKYIYPARR